MTGSVRIARRLVLALLCGMLVCAGGVARAADEATAAPADSTVSVHRRLGESMARSEWRAFPGTFATGVGFGMVLPVLGAVSASTVSHEFGGNDLAATVVGVTTATLWAWGGHRLVSRRPVSVPERHHAALDARDWAEFDAGYTAIAGDKRTAQYTIGTIIGITIPFAVVLYVLSHLSFST